ncbi:Bromodomain-containing protein [Gyrodon lividus]|nr:Bromodomain-containing protein [Gyrodon lividus]
MNDASLECSEANDVPHAPLNLRLAQRHYSARLLQLRDLIAAEEVKFKRLVAEIDEIRSGAWDDRIRAKLACKDEPVIHLAETQLPSIEHVAEAQENTEQGTVAVDDQEPSRQSSEEGDTEAQAIDESAKQLIVDEFTLGPSIGDEVASGTPPAEDVDHRVQESPPATDVTEVLHEESPKDETMGENIRAFDSHETTQMEVDESADHQEREPAVNQEGQQRDGKRKASDSEGSDEGLRDKKRPREDSASTDADEPGAAVGSSSRRRGAASNEPTSHLQIPPSVPNKRFQTVIGMLHSQISQHRNGNIFHNPIKNSEAPDYHEIIKRPMDLKTIKARVKDGIISNSLEFQRDVYLMFANAMMYNRPGSDIYQMAEEMMIESEVHINTFRQTEGFVRSTRS